MQRVSPSAALMLALIAAIPSAQAAKGDRTDCFRDLMRGRGAEIACEFPVRPNADELAALQKQSRGLVKQAHCTVSIRIDRALIAAALDNPDHVFQAPPQPVTCDVTTKGREQDQTYPITGHFAPKVTLKDGKAVDATPGLGNVQGVPRPLSWPVELWVNSGSHVKTSMLQVINAWLDHMRNDRPQRQAQR